MKTAWDELDKMDDADYYWNVVMSGFGTGVVLQLMFVILKFFIRLA